MELSILLKNGQNALTTRKNSPIIHGNIHYDATKSSFRSSFSGLPHFLAENESFWGCQGIFLIEFEQRSASQHRPKQSKQSKIKYHTTFFFTIPLPKQIKKVVITTKIPVKQSHCAVGGLAARGRGVRAWCWSFSSWLPRPDRPPR